MPMAAIPGPGGISTKPQPNRYPTKALHIEEALSPRKPRASPWQCPFRPAAAFGRPISAMFSCLFQQTKLPIDKAQG